VFWRDRSVRAAPWGEAALAAHYIVPREEASYLLYLELSLPR